MLLPKFTKAAKIGRRGHNPVLFRRKQRPAIPWEVLEERCLLASDWQNPVIHEDVDYSGIVALPDVLAVVADLRENGIPHLLPPPVDGMAAPPPYLNVNGNSTEAGAEAFEVVSIEDLLSVIIQLREGIGSPVTLLEARLENDTGDPNDRVTFNPMIVGRACFEGDFGVPTDGLCNAPRVIARVDNGPWRIVDLLSHNAGQFQFDPALAPGTLSGVEHTVELVAQYLGGPWKTASLTFTLTTPAQIAELSPRSGDTSVNVLRDVVINFDRPLDAASVDDASISLVALGEQVPAQRYVGDDRKSVRLIPANPLPSSTEVRVVVDGDQLRSFDGEPVDADGDFQAGGLGDFFFRTVSATRLPNTNVRGRVIASERGASGEDLPLKNVTIRVDGMPDLFAVTDENGEFELEGTPAPDFFVRVDGSTVTHVGSVPVASDGFYPVVGKPFHSIPGETVAIPFNIHLPFVLDEAMHDIPAQGDMALSLPPSQVGSDPNLAMVKLTVPEGTLLKRDGTPATRAGIFQVASDRLPAPLPPGANHAFDITIQTDGAFFTQPAAVEFPNLAGLPPNEKAALISFNHSLGEWVTVGTMTVSNDGQRVVSDPGSGIIEPGWHYFDTLLNVVGAVTNFVDTRAGCLANNAGELASLGLDLLSGALSAIAATPDWASNLSKYLAGASLGVNNYVLPSVSIGVGTPIDFGKATGAGTLLIGGLGLGVAAAAGATVQEALGTLIVTAAIAGGLVTASAAAAGIAIGIGGCAANPDFSFDNLRGEGEPESTLSPTNIGQLVDLAKAAMERGSMHLMAVQSLVTEFTSRISESYAILMAPGLRRFVGEDLSGFTFEIRSTGEFVVFEQSTGQRAIDPEMGEPYELTVVEILTGVIPSEADKSAINQLLNTTEFTSLQMEIDTAAQVAVEEFKTAFEYFDLVVTAAKGPKQGVYYAIREDGEVVARGRTNLQGAWDERLPRGREFSIAYFNPSLTLSGTSNFSTLIQQIPDPGSVTIQLQHGVDILETPQAFVHLWQREGVLRSLFNDLEGEEPSDLDGDGLGPIAEEAIGTRPDLADTDGDGIDDLTEVLQGTDPLGDRGFATGLIASVPLRGNTNEIVVHAGQTVQDRTAFAATGSDGLAVVDAGDFDAPVALGRLDLPGDATDIAVNAAGDMVYVAANAGGVHRVDGKDRMAPALIDTIPVTAGQIEIAGETAYLGGLGEVVAVNVATGVVRERLALGTAAISGMAREGTLLYTMDQLGVFRVIDLMAVPLRQRGAVHTVDGAGKISVNSDVVYASSINADNRGGFATIDVSDPDQPRVISNSDVVAPEVAPGTAIVANGSGRGLLAGVPRGSNNPMLAIVDVSDPANTRFSEIEAQARRVDLPSRPEGVTLASGIAYVAGGASGMHVANYLPFDVDGQPPTAPELHIPDADPALPGIQVLDGASVLAHAASADDVQVARVELFVEATIAAVSLAPPHNLTFTAPLLSEGETSRTAALLVRAIDTGGNISETVEISIEVVRNGTGPAVLEMDPAPGDTRPVGIANSATLRFSKPLADSSAAPGVFRLRDGQGAEVPGVAVTLSPDQRTVALSFSPLAAGEYLLEIDAASVTDRAGNQLGEGVIARPFSVVEVDVYWTGDGGDDRWQTPANWSTGTLPGPADVVLISSPGVVNVTFRNPVATTATVGSLICDESLTVARGRLEMLSNSSFAELIVDPGTQLISDQVVTIRRKFAWLGGTLAVAYLVNETYLEIVGADRKSLQGELVNQGVIQWLDGNLNNDGVPSTWRNLAGSKFFSSASAEFASNVETDNPPQFINDGEFTSASGTTSFEADFVNHGVVHILQDTFHLERFQHGTGTSDGAFVVDETALLVFGGPNRDVDFAFLPGATIVGLGRAIVIQGHVDFGSGYQLDDLTLSGGDTRFDVGADVPGRVTIDGGNATNGRFLGDVIWLGGTLGGEIGIAPGATLTVLHQQGTIEGDVTSAGQIVLGGMSSTGTLAISGDFAQLAAGALLFDVAPSIAQNLQDRLVVGGEVELAGRLMIQFLTLPTIGQAFPLITANSQLGEFDLIEALMLAADQMAEILYGETFVELRVVDHAGEGGS